MGINWNDLARRKANRPRTAKLFSGFVFLFCLFVAANVAQAGTVTFAISDLPLYTGSGTYSACTRSASGNAGCTTSDNNTSQGMTSITSYMNSAILSQVGAGGGTVTVTGAVGSNSYDGEGFVVGNNGSNMVGTLAGSTGATFIMNNQHQSSGKTGSLVAMSGPGAVDAVSPDDIIMSFSNLSITAVSFMAEIFPDGSGQTPDLELFGASTGGATFTTEAQFAASPNATWLGTDPSASSCKASANNACEHSLQMGPTQVSFTFASAVNALDFRDWPPTIAIQNLVLTTSTGGSGSGVPEPSSILLLGVGLGGLVAARRRLAKGQQ